MIKDFTDLIAWQEAFRLSIEIYKATKTFPRNEVFGISSQMRRAAVSIPSNLAEGFARSSVKEKINFYFISQGSATELQTQFLIAKEIGYIDSNIFASIFALSKNTSRLIAGLIRSSRNRLSVS